MKLMNRHAVVIEFPDERRPVVIGPFKSYGRACVRRDEISEYMLDEHELEDGTDYVIHTITCHSTTTTNNEIEGFFQ